MKNGGPAFPAGSVRKSRLRPSDAGSEFIVSDRVEPMNSGMTLRDYFAAKAMQGDIATVERGHDWTLYMDEFAKHAYAMADAMLAAREAK